MQVELEVKRCPAHFQERITRAGGLNRYGTPNFILGWSQTETFRAGGVWPDDRFAGYREVYVANCSPYAPRDGYWMLMEWEGPEAYGDEALYHFTNRDANTGLTSLGPYPHRGHYKLAVKLVNTIIDNGTLRVLPWELTSKVIDLVVPTVIAAKKDTLSRRLRFEEEQRQKRERRMVNAMEAVMKDSKRPLMTQEKIDDRVRLMEKQWAAWLRNPRLRKGFQQSPAA